MVDEIVGVYTGLAWFEIADVVDKYDDIKSAYTYPHPYEDTVFSTYVEANGRIGVPHGDLPKVQNIIGKHTIDDRRISPGANIKFVGKPLRDYQEEAYDRIQEYVTDGGTAFNLSGQPGSGKSYMLSYVLSKLKVKTLVIAHLSMLTEQLHAELSSNISSDIRMLNKDNLTLGDVNIATSQFISNRPELWKEIKHNIGLIVIDESESSASLTTLRILQRAHAKYRIFISATFTRSVDRRTGALLDLAGDKVITLENNALMKPTVITVNCEEYFQAPLNKNLYKKRLISFFKQNQTIDEKILHIVKGSLAKDRQVLIACDLTEFQEKYAVMLEANDISCAVMNGTTSKTDRPAILESFNEGKIKVLLGFGVLNAGLSMPKISTIIRVSTPGNVEKLEQLIGRARRDYDGKDGAFIIDLMFRGFNNANGNRQRFYKQKVKKEGWTLSMTSWEKLKEKLS